MKRPLFLSFSLLLFFFFNSAAYADTQFLGSQETLQTFIENAQNAKLYQDREWLLLGHYKKHPKYWMEFLSEVDGESFFLSPNGKTSAQDELIATLKAFFEPSSWYKEERLHPQCRFPARRGWLVEKLQIKPEQLKLLPCQFQADWKKRLDADKISIIFAASYMNNPASMFGHTFLKFHKRGQSSENDLLNYGLNFAASTGSDGGAPFMIKGLIGGYKGEYSFMPYYLKLLDYSNVEGRDIWEYTLTLDQNEVNRLVDHLLELEQTHFDYYFFSENCSYQLLTLLEWARPSLRMQDYFFYQVIPADTVSLMSQQDNLIAKVSYRPALRQSLEARLKILNSDEEKIAKDFFKNQRLPELLSKIKDRDPESQAHILDAALAYGAVKQFKNRDDWKEPMFQLQSERARLGINSERVEIQSNEGPPHQAHPPARFSVGPGYQKGDHGFLNLGLRMAYHELTDSDVGLLAGSQIQFFYLQGRYNYEREVLDFTRFRLFELVSLTPWGIYQKPISWKAALGYENTFSEDMLHFTGGVGSSFELLSKRKLLLGIFTNAEVDHQKEFENKHLFAAGPGVTLRWAPTDHFRILLETQSLWNTNEAFWQTETRANTSFNWSQKDQLNLQFKSKNYEGFDANEIMLVYERFILL